MTAIPFAKEAYKKVRASSPESVVLNFIVEHDVSGEAQDKEELAMLLQRPGLTSYQTLPGIVQGLYITENSSFNYQFAVSNNHLCYFDRNGYTVVGDITGDIQRVKMVANFDRLCVVSYPNVWLYGASVTSQTPSFRQLTIPDYFGTGSPKVVDVAHIDGYFVLACEDGTFLWLVPGEDTLDPLNFATAEADPDGLVGVDILNGNLMFFGQRTVENWQTTGNSDLPFQRTQGQDYRRGCLARDTVVSMDNTLIFVGEDGKVYRAANVPTKISTDGIDERIRLRTGHPAAWSFDFDGHLFYVLDVPGQGTFVYDVSSTTWQQFSSTDASVLWYPWCATQIDDGWLVGSRNSGKVWSITDAATDDGLAFPRRATATAPIPGKPIPLDNVVFDVGSTGACSFRFRWADADENLSTQQWVGLDCKPGGNSLTYYRMGAARQPYRTLEIEVLDPVIIRFSGGRLGEAYR